MDHFSLTRPERFKRAATVQARYRPGIVPGGSLALLLSDTGTETERCENAYGRPQARVSPRRHYSSRSVAELALDTSENTAWQLRFLVPAGIVIGIGQFYGTRQRCSTVRAGK